MTTERIEQNVELGGARRLPKLRSPERTQARITAFNTAGYALKHLHKNDVHLVLRALNLCYAKRGSNGSP